jgi:molecular chaperone DnaK
LKEFGDKLSADKKAAIEAAHAELKTAFEAKNGDDVKAKTEALDAAWMAASEELYAAGQGASGADAGAQNPGGNNAGGEDVQDADFEEVK